MPAKKESSTNSKTKVTPEAKTDVKTSISADKKITTTAKKTPAKKAAPAAKRQAIKKSAKDPAVYVQFEEKEIVIKEVIERVYHVWTKTMGNLKKDIVDLKIYIKPDEHKIYYVINETTTGSIDL